MVKHRMSTADVAGEVACLRQSILGMRVANVYDINPKTYVLKLARSGEDGEKVLLLIESGVRFHTVQAMPPKSATPSNFSLKLRKHIRTRRVEGVQQLGVDRVVDFTFGTGEGRFHLILELFAQGNVVLTDSKYEVLTLLRSHRDDAKGFAVMPRHPYPIHTIRLRTPLAPEALDAALGAAGEGATLKGILSDLLPYGPHIAEHCVRSAGLDPARPLAPGQPPLSAEELWALLGGVRGWERWLDECEERPPEGWIYVKRAKPEAEPTYEEFEPLQLAQHAGREALPPFPTFDAALNEFFGKIQGQRASAQQEVREKAVTGKLEAIRRDHERRLAALASESEAAELKARLIEYNLVAVDAALDSVREAVAAGMDWRDLSRMIKEERRAGNPVAGLIDSLQLDRNKVTLLLSNWLDEDDGDEEAATRPATKVEVDLGLSAHSNARSYYDTRRKHQSKASKTLGANQKALKAAEKKAQAQLQQVRSAPAAVPARKPYWFERFHWFVSSENYLVLSGRDAQQNELLVKRYLRPGDVYVHADLHGASTTIIKNHQPGQPIPPLTLSQAGQACVCRSQAWDAKIVTSAWWVYPEQVSKTAPSGEYLTTGSFMIRGKKNYLPPQPLVMGFGFLFRLEDSCIPAHLGERAPRLAKGDGTAAAGGAAEQGGEEEEGAGEEEAGSDGEAGSSDSEQEADGEEQGEGFSGRSALDAFLDASADRRLPPGGGAPPPARQASAAGSSSRGPGRGGSSSGGRQVGDLASAFERYGLGEHLPSAGGLAGAGGVEGEGGAPGAVQQQAEQAQQGGGRRHLSAKERQLLKKGQAGGQPAEAGGAKQSQQQQAQQKAKQQQQQQQQQKQQELQQQQQQQQQQGVRGRGGKGKRAKQRYGDQDEEERELAMQVLQSAGQKKDRTERKAERKQRMAARKAAKTGAPVQEITPEALAALSARPTTDVVEGSDGEDEAEPDLGSNASSSDDEGSEAAGAAAAQGAEEAAGGNEAAAAAGAEGSGGGSSAAAAGGAGEEDEGEGKGGQGPGAGEEEEEAAGEEEKERGSHQLDALTGCPRAEDILLFAVPVCAPYQVMASYKYKVKLVPGTLKKGKAVRQATELLSRSVEVTQRERDLMKAVPEMDGINSMVGTVKLQVAGLQKMKQGQKKARKKAAAGQ